MPCAVCGATAAIARAVGGETELDRILELVVKRGRALWRPTMSSSCSATATTS